MGYTVDEQELLSTYTLAQGNTVITTLDDILDNAFAETVAECRGKTKNLTIWRRVYSAKAGEDIASYNQVVTDAKQRKSGLTNLSARMVADIMMEVFTIISLNMASPKTDEVSQAYTPAIYNEDLGIYEISQDAFENKILELVTADDKMMRSIMDIIKARAKKYDKRVRTGFADGELDLIPFKNGILDYHTKQLMPFSSDYVFTWRVNCNWNPNAVDVPYTMKDGTVINWEDWLLDIMDNSEEDKKLVKQIIGALVRPMVDWQESIFFYSIAGSSGKGALLEMFRAIVGKHHVDLSLQELECKDSQFNLQQAFENGSVAVLSDENDVGGYIDGSANFKKLATHDWVTVNRKYKDAVTCKFFMLLVECLNELPRVQDYKDAFFRRVKGLEFKKHFSQDDKDLDIKNVWLQDEKLIEYVMKSVLLDIDDYYKLDDTQNTIDTKAAMLQANSPVLRFVMEVLEDIDLSRMPIPIVYQLYKSWYEKTNPGQKCMGDEKFKQDLAQALQSNPVWMFEPRKTFGISDAYVKELIEHPVEAILLYNCVELMDMRNPGAVSHNRAIITQDKLAKKYNGGIWKRKATV